MPAGAAATREEVAAGSRRFLYGLSTPTTPVADPPVDRAHADSIARAGGRHQDLEVRAIARGHLAGHRGQRRAHHVPGAVEGLDEKLYIDGRHVASIVRVAGHAL